MAQDWYTPNTAGQNGEATGVLPDLLPPPQPPVFHLRPLSLGEVLDRTFTVYRSYFLLFAGIGCVAAALVTLVNAIQLLPLHMGKAAGTLDRTANPFGLASPLSPNYLAGLGIGFAVVLLAFLVVYTFVYVVTQAATVHAVQEVYLGRQTTIGSSLGATIGLWYRYLGIGIWQFGSMIWIPLAAIVVGVALATVVPVLGGVVAVLGGLAGFVVGFILYLRNALGVQTSVTESLTVREAMRRSKELTVGAKGRIFVLLLLAGALNYAANLLHLPLLLFVTFTMARGGQAIGSEVAMMLVSFVSHAVVQPVAMIGLSLLYFDQRVRLEALDLQLMLGVEPTMQPAAVETAPDPAGAMGADGRV